MGLLTVCMSTLTYWSFYFFIFLARFFFYAARIGYTFGCYYPMIFNSLGHCLCVHQGKISAAAGFKPGTTGLWVNHATSELTWRHSLTSLTGECAAEKLRNFCCSSLWTCLHHMVILLSQKKITDFLMILAWVSPFTILKIALQILDQMWSIYLVLFAWLSVCRRHTLAYPEKKRQSYVIFIEFEWNGLKVSKGYNLKKIESS